MTPQQVVKHVDARENVHRVGSTAGVVVAVGVGGVSVNGVCQRDATTGESQRGGGEGGNQDSHSVPFMDVWGVTICAV